MSAFHLVMFSGAVIGIIWWLRHSVLRLARFRGLAWARGVASGYLRAQDAGQIFLLTEFEFVVHNRRYRMIDYISFGLTCYQVGDEVWVRYDPADCERAYVWRTWPEAIGIVGALLTLAAVCWEVRMALGA